MSLEATKHYIKLAAEILGLPEHITRMMTKPSRVIETNITIEMDNGSVKTFTGYRIQHNHALGPMKGGIRYHPTVTEEEIESLASLMTWKTSLLQLPFGGAKGGIECDPQQLSESEVERLTKSYADKIKEIVGPYRDIPGPDINTNAQIMAWFMSEYSKHYGFTPAVITGKPIFLHGSEGREQATGFGLQIITELLFALHKKTIKDSTFVIQGFGNVGYYVAKFLHEKGGKVISVSDTKGGIYNQMGIDIPALKQYQSSKKTVQGFNDTVPISNEDLLTLQCDVLIPAALGDVFDKRTAGSVNCRFIVEGANGPTTPEADELFQERGIIVVPDILANAGGVIVSYFEWVQNIQQFRWEIERIKAELNHFLREAFYRVITLAKEKHCSYRTAAYILGLGRVAKASLTLGL
jgi:glutamate dehydrogenase (NAD(P)+)